MVNFDTIINMDIQNYVEPPVMIRLNNLEQTSPRKRSN